MSLRDTESFVDDHLRDLDHVKIARRARVTAVDHGSVKFVSVQTR